jgi:hypothetical protein
VNEGRQHIAAARQLALDVEVVTVYGRRPTTSWFPFTGLILRPVGLTRVSANTVDRKELANVDA